MEIHNMKNKLNLFGIKELTQGSARELLKKAQLSRKEKQLIEYAIEQKIQDVGVQALIYTLATGQRVHQIKRILNPLEDPYGNAYIGFQKQLASLHLLVGNNMESDLDSWFTVGERHNKAGKLKSLIRWSGAPYSFFINIDPESPNTKFIYSVRFAENFPSDILDKEDVFSDGPINFLIWAGTTSLPIIGVTEISNIGKNITYDRNGKHDCRYSLDDLAM